MEGDQNEYGFVLVNGASAPIRDVKVSGVLHGKNVVSDSMAILPPGTYFIRLLGSGEWAYPVELGEYGKPVRPYTRTERYFVHSTEVLDINNRRWRRTLAGGIERIPETAS